MTSVKIDRKSDEEVVLQMTQIKEEKLAIITKKKEGGGGEVPVQIVTKTDRGNRIKGGRF